MAKPLSYTLKHDIVVTTKGSDGVEHEEVLRPAGTEIALRTPRGKDMRLIDQFPNAEIALTIAMIVRLSQLDLSEADHLEVEDLMGLGELLADFMPDGPKIGATS